MKIDSLIVKSHGESGKLKDPDYQGRVMAIFQPVWTDKNGHSLSSQFIMEAAIKSDAVPVRLENGSQVGKVLSYTLNSDKSISVWIKIDTDTYPSLWHGITEGYIEDVSIEMAD